MVMVIYCQYLIFSPRFCYGWTYYIEAVKSININIIICLALLIKWTSETEH